MIYFIIMIGGNNSNGNSEKIWEIFNCKNKWTRDQLSGNSYLKPQKNYYSSGLCFIWLFSSSYYADGLFCLHYKDCESISLNVLSWDVVQHYSWNSLLHALSCAFPNHSILRNSISISILNEEAIPGKRIFEAVQKASISLQRHTE